MATLAAAGDAVGGAPAKKLRILILGGTGFIGPHQVRYALARGHTVTLFNRGREPDAWGGQVEQLIGDRNTGDLKALEGGQWDVCIDNPTTLPFWVRDAGKVLAGKVGHYIFVSTISVYASNATPHADETAAVLPYVGADPMAETGATLAASKGALYGPLKAVSEAEAGRQFGAATTIVRPGLIVGPGDETDRFTYWPVRIAQGGDVAAPGDGRDPVQIIDARDLSEWIIRMAEDRKLGVFNADGPARELSMAAMLAGTATAIGASPKLVWIPETVLDANNVSAWSDMPVWVPGHGETAGFARRNIGKALHAGLTLRPLATTAKDTLDWFKTLPEVRQAKMRAGLTADRETQLLASAKAKS
ncbi:MAG TPA: NAD-dependent epimerase/dehydratase family protein [Caulobacteraceae bacterium]|jgi:2'-hydroxyisoflavone reductase